MGRTVASDAWFWAALLLVGLITTADVLDEGTSLAGALAVAPFVASVMCSAARTAVVSVVSLGVGLWLTTQESPQTLTVVVRVSVVTLAAALAPVLATIRVRREQRMRDLRQVAEAAQLAVLTPIPPVVGPTRIASLYQSASREALIGGDLYGVVETRRGLRLMVGDVRGKGIGAVRTAAVALAAFREGTQQPSSLTDAARHCDEQLRRHLADEDFVTAIFADIGHDGTVELVNCGHPNPLLVQRGRVIHLQTSHPATPLGLPAEFSTPPRAERTRIDRGDRLLFYTDGLVEARDSEGNFIDIDHVVGDVGHAELHDALTGVLTRLHASAREVRDDLAMLLVEYTGPATPEALSGQQQSTRRSSW